MLQTRAGQGSWMDKSLCMIEDQDSSWAGEMAQSLKAKLTTKSIRI